MRRQRTQSKLKLQMSIEPITFRTQVGRSSIESQELIWKAKSLYWFDSGLELRLFLSSVSSHYFFHYHL